MHLYIRDARQDTGMIVAGFDKSSRTIVWSDSSRSTDPCPSSCGASAIRSGIVKKGPPASGRRPLRSEGIDKVKPELISLRLVSRLELRLPFERETHVPVAILYHRPDGEYPPFESRGADLGAVELILRDLAIVVAAKANGQLPADVIADGLVRMELLAGLVLGFLVLQVDVVHELG